MSTPSLDLVAQPHASATALSRNERELGLVARARGGDRKALSTLWHEYQGPVFHYFSRSVASHEEAEDLTSETLIAVFDNISRFRGVPHANQPSASPHASRPNSSISRDSAHEVTFKAFVFGVANNHLKHWIRKKNVRAQKTAASFDANSDSERSDVEMAFNSVGDRNADPLTAILRKQHLDSACYALADVGIQSCEQFKALIFHYACGLPHKDIATLLSTRKETVNTRLQEGRNSLRAMYANSAYA